MTFQVNSVIFSVFLLSMEPFASQISNVVSLCNLILPKSFHIARQWSFASKTVSEKCFLDSFHLMMNLPMKSFFEEQRIMVKSQNNHQTFLIVHFYRTFENLIDLF